MTSKYDSSGVQSSDKCCVQYIAENQWNYRGLKTRTDYVQKCHFEKNEFKSLITEHRA